MRSSVKCRPEAVFLVLSVLTLGITSASSQPVSGYLECVDCALCAENGLTGHKAPAGDESSIYDLGAGPHSGCSLVSGGCSGWHDLNEQCPGFQVDAPDDPTALLDAIEAAASTGDAAAIKEIIDSAPAGFLVSIPELDAVEAFGCRHQIIAHIPVRLATE